MMIRYKFVEIAIVKFLKTINSELMVYPLDLISIIKSIPDLKLWSYQYYARRYKCSLEEVYIFCNSESGCIKRDNQTGQSIILFNKDLPAGRVQWTLGHELGHHILNHFAIEGTQGFAQNQLITLTNKELDYESDYFSATINSPFPLYESLNVKSSLDIQRTFNLSIEASKNRYKQYLKWKDIKIKTAFENDIKRMFDLNSGNT